MAQEVSLDSLQELEQEAVLRVLHRDRAVQSIEEERVRYVPLDGGSVGVVAFSAGSCPRDMAYGSSQPPQPLV